MPGFGAFDGFECNARIKCHQAAATVNRKGEQVHISELTWSVNPRGIKAALVHQTETIGPELMDRVGRGQSQSLDDLLQRLCIGVSRMRHDPHTAVLGNWR